jgi:hypothetical protein
MVDKPGLGRSAFVVPIRQRLSERAPLGRSHLLTRGAPNGDGSRQGRLTCRAVPSSY